MTSKRALAIAAVVAAVTLAGVWVVSYLRESPPSSVETTEAGPTVAADGEVAAAAEEKTPEPDVTEAEAEEMLADVLKAREVSASVTRPTGRPSKSSGGASKETCTGGIARRMRSR